MNTSQMLSKSRWYILPLLGCLLTVLGVWLGYIAKPQRDVLLEWLFCLANFNQMGDAFVRSLHTGHYSRAYEMLGSTAQQSYSVDKLRLQWQSFEREIGAVRGWYVREAHSRIAPADNSIDYRITYYVHGNRKNGLLEIHLYGSCDRPQIVSVFFARRCGEQVDWSRAE